jgi:hypothetical protein
MLAPAAVQAAPGCPPVDWNADRLAGLKAHQFAIKDDVSRQKLALDLLPCLADENPGIRDGIAFEAYSSWLRDGKLDEKTRLAIFKQLLPALSPDAVDDIGFRQPFSALVMAEVARADRKASFLSAAQRQQLVEAAARYVESVRDYRGFDQAQGWRHGVAHGADLLMQLALNEALDKAQLDRILAAVRSQIAPAGEHFYIYGESERLARPALFIAMRGLHSTQEWDNWFQQIAAPAPLANWEQAYQSNAGLAKRHDTKAFLLLVYTEIRHSQNENLGKLVPGVTEALKVVP